MPDHEELEQLLQNREKVLKGLEYCIESVDGACPDECPYRKECYGRDFMYVPMRDAFKLLKEQQEIVRCKDCKHRDPEDHKCDCGHDIQWQLPRADDWFCADGERR